ncbi:MAG: hypothetical protein RLZZ394_46, partial [Actinomycetota bacterium]
MSESNAEDVTGASAHPSENLDFFYHDQRLSGTNGDSIASAMVRNSKLICRENESGEPRGIFCGMGVCNECQVEVDGESGVLACMRSLHAGAKIHRQEQHRHSPTGPAGSELIPPALDEITLNPDLLIIGGGPAGLSLARSLIKDGLSPDSIIIIDERKSLGGQYFKQRQIKMQGTSSDQGLDSQFREGAE